MEMTVTREDVAPALLGESVGEVVVGKTAIPLPYPCLTNTDINYAVELSREFAVDASFPNLIHETKQWLWQKKLDELMSPKGTIEWQGWIAAQHGRAVSGSKAELFLYTPLFTKNVNVTPNVVRRITKMQVECDATKIVNIPDAPLLPRDRMLELMKELATEVLDAKKLPFFYINMASEELEFEARLQAAKTHMNGVTVRYSSPQKYFRNVRLLAESRGPDFLRFLSNVERVYPRFGHCAVEPLALLCADIFSPKLGIGGADEREMERRERTNAKRLHQDKIGFYTVSHHKREFGESLGCVCPVDEGNGISDVAADFSGHLAEAFRVHEPYAVFDIVEQARDMICRGKLGELTGKKPHAKRVAEDLFGVGQATLPQ